jgi:hypothetical protein
MHESFVPLAIVCGLLVGGGCSREAGPKTVPASGKVLYNGQPVAGAKVAFLGDGNSLPALGITDKNGEFELTTRDPGDGAVPGKHVVTVSKAVPGKKQTGPADNSMEAAVARGKEAESDQPSLSLLPDHYAIASQSGLQQTVSESGKNYFTIELHD